ncbi:HesB/IscA family protein [Algiphilus aromaticivorans]|jgi:iron-sulfur cluster assembly protein|uniref:HesB/IscA family protein n=1 Tax=Algiphilus aromaticivorans TaxID=382454 RepID=UPI0005C2550A|nr:iron-sulfur cluster assembly accessory protein [Algiphilus aromaticivorans]
MSITLSEAAADRIRRQLAERGQGIGLRVGVTTTGCSGNAYKLDYADAVGEDEVAFEQHGATVVVAKRDLPMLDGLNVDFRREGLNELYRFDNPNATGLCGCGESFHLAEEEAAS